MRMKNTAHIDFVKKIPHNTHVYTHARADITLTRFTMALQQLQLKEIIKAKPKKKVIEDEKDSAYLYSIRADAVERKAKYDGKMQKKVERKAKEAKAEEARN